MKLLRPVYGNTAILFYERETTSSRMTELYGLAVAVPVHQHLSLYKQNKWGAHSGSSGVSKHQIYESVRQKVYKRCWG